MAREWGLTRDQAAERMRIPAISDPLLDLAWNRQAFSEPETEWERREVRVFLPPSVNAAFVRCGIIGIGQLLIDDASLTLEPAREPAELPLRRNLLADPGFEDPVGNDWEYSIPPYPGIRAVRDTVVKRSGRSSLHFITPRAALVPGPTGVAPVFCNRNFAGKRVRLQAFIKTDSLMSNVFLKLQCKGPSGVSQEVSKGIISGTRDWTRAEIEYDVPPDTYAVWAWINYTAPARGRAYFDDASFEVLGPASATRGSR
jgi:hypothetical protein